MSRLLHIATEHGVLRTYLDTGVPEDDGMVAAVRVATSLIPFKCGRWAFWCRTGIVHYLVQLCLNCILPAK